MRRPQLAFGAADARALRASSAWRCEVRCVEGERLVDGTSRRESGASLCPWCSDVRSRSNADLSALDAAVDLMEGPSSRTRRCSAVSSPSKTPLSPKTRRDSSTFTRPLTLVLRHDTRPGACLRGLAERRWAYPPAGIRHNLSGRGYDPIVLQTARCHLCVCGVRHPHGIRRSDRCGDRADPDHL